MTRLVWRNAKSALGAPFSRWMTRRMIQSAAIARLLEQIGRAIHSRGHSHGLYPAQWTALRYFANADAGSCSTTALAAYQGMAFGPVSRTVRTLIAKGLVQKCAAPSRGRYELVEVTQTGRDLLIEDPLGRVCDALAALPESNREALAFALEAIVLRLQATHWEEPKAVRREPLG